MALQPTLPAETTANTTVIKNWCHTRQESKTIQFVWTIHQFSSCREERYQFVESSIFPPKMSKYNAPKWRMRAYPKGESNPEYLDICVILYSGTNVRAKVQLSVMNDKNEKVKTQEISRRCYDQEKESYAKPFVKLAELSTLGLLPQDTLTILCEVYEISESVISGDIPEEVKPSDITSASVSGDIAALYDSEQFTDVKLIAGGHELKAHKAILSARSKVFAAMFHHPMKEQISDRVSITDVQPEVLKEMLRFLYTDKVSNLDEMAGELLAVSDKYEIPNLKRMCEESLRANVTVDNAASTLILADRHNVNELKSKILKFIAGNAKAVSLTEGWSDMKSSHTELIAEAFCAIAETVSK